MAREIICASREEWLAQRRLGVTASEISAILGLSPWLSAFSLYWQKVMAYEQDDNPAMARGRRLEALVREDFMAAHHDVVTVHLANAPGYATMYGHDERTWQLATPDALVWPAHIVNAAKPYMHLGGVMPLELKTAANRNGWGPSGSDVIPNHYRAQVLWQIDVLDADEGWLAVWIGLDDYREYLIKRDEEDLAVMRAAAEQFMEQVKSETPPSVDGLASTTATLRQLHPQITDDDVTIPDELAESWAKARQEVIDAKAECRALENEVRALMGAAGRAVDSDQRTVATRVIYTRPAYQAKEATIDRLYPRRLK